MTAALVKYASYSSVMLIMLGMVAVLVIWLLVVTILLMASRGRLDSAQRAIKRLNVDVKAAGRMRRGRPGSDTAPEMPAALPTGPIDTLNTFFNPPVPPPAPPPATAPVGVQWRAEPVPSTNPIRSQQPPRPNGRHSATDRNRIR